MIKYISGLNGIRAIAVFMVIIWHRFPDDHFMKSLPLGPYGVDVFFVLSGFLISRILFNDLKNVKEKSSIALGLIKKFIIRRSLRIFPIYYLLLFFMYFTNGTVGYSFKQNFLWYFFYGSNYLFYKNDNWYGCLAHLWSLAVEEQFYLIWPFMILIFFKDKIFFLLITTILIGTFSPFFIDGNSYVLTICCVNAFGIGALLAYVEINSADKISTFTKWINFLSVIALILIIIHYYFYKFSIFFDRFFVSIIAVAIISYCRFSKNSFVVNKILENKVLVFLGTISYGIYLYHHVVPRYWVIYFQKLGIKTPSTTNHFSYIEFLIQTAFIVFLSYLSWIIIEKPILKFKDKIS